MRIEPISLFGGGRPDWSIMSVPSVSPQVIERWNAAEAMRQQQKIQHQHELYMKGTVNLARQMNESHSNAYDWNGGISQYDSAGAEFDAKI